MVYFRPYPVMTVAGLAALAVLIGLGTWQMGRRAEKHAFLASVEARRAAAPVPLEEGLARADPHFVRVRIDLPAKCEAQALVNAFRIVNTVTVPGADLLTAAATADGKTIWISRGFVPETVLRNWGEGAARAPCPAAVTGVAVLTPSREAGSFTPPPDLAGRRWYVYDAAGMAAALNLPLAVPVIARLEPSPGDAGWPRPQAYAQDIPDNHLTYAMTWYGLALTLVGVYAAFHVAAGRLRWTR